MKAVALGFGLAMIFMFALVGAFTVAFVGTVGPDATAVCVGSAAVHYVTTHQDPEADDD